MPNKPTRRDFLTLSAKTATALAVDTFGGVTTDRAATGPGNFAYYYVATTGSDHNPGTLDLPFRTVQRAAAEMKPGDTCLVRGGVYREWVTPPRGGVSEDRRITYKAYPGETAVLTGSERINTWKDQGQGIWLAELPQFFFGDFNPYTMPIYGDLKSKSKLEDKDIWMDFGQDFHLGDVYSDGLPYLETLTKEEMQGTAQTWYTETIGGVTRIWAHFGGGDPNQQLSEINVRECVFFPSTRGLQYITVNGFTMRHAACYWAAPNSFQKGLVGTHVGKSWIIEHCHITDAKCVGVCSGYVHDAHSADISQIGHHAVRNNIIERCGEAGIAGLIGFADSEITGNLIQDINYKMQFGGQETAGIKVHRATDLKISHNIIRRVFSTKTRTNTYSHFPGIWIDWSNQGVRITGNVIYDIDDYTIYVEANHGPLLIDNNILIGSPIGSESERLILAHNLLCDSGIMYMNRETRNPDYYQPHTLTAVKDAFLSKVEDRYYNNVFIGRGADRLHSDMSVEPQHARDFRSACNVYYAGMPRQPWDQSGVENDRFQATCQVRNLTKGLVLRLSVDKSAIGLKCPQVNSKLIGKFSLVNQGMEELDGRPLQISRDYFGEKRNAKHPRVGPFEQLRAGTNTFTLTLP